MTGLLAPPRYDDSVVNLLRLESDTTPVVRASLYRNLIDLMMQDRPSTRGATRTRIFETLSRLHPNVSPAVRRDVALRVSHQSQPQPLDLVLWLWTGDPDMSSAMLPNLQLRQADWQALMPKLPKSALGLLSVRPDLPPAIQRALASLGSGGIEIGHAPSAVAADTPPVALSPAPLDVSGLSVVSEAVADDGVAAQTPDAPDVAQASSPETPLELMDVDWNQLRKARVAEPNHLDSVARSIFVAPPEWVIASNDDVPGGPEMLPKATIAPETGEPAPEALSEEAQAQIRDLIQRIADFRKRWIDRPPLSPSPVGVVSRSASGEARHDEIAGAIQLEMERAGLAFAEAPPGLPVFDLLADDEIVDIAAQETMPEHQTEADSEALLLTPAVAHRMPPVGPMPPVAAPSPPSPREQQSAEQHSLTQLAATLADWQWEADRSGRFLQAQAPGAERTDLFPSLRGTRLLTLFGQSPSAKVVMRALERRSAFRDAEFVHADGVLAGRWLLSGVAVFDPRTGLFLGHRGIARRLEVAEPEPAAAQPGVTGFLPAEALTTLAHETRTPLNAIMGFAQLIDAQTWGAVPAPYAPQASAILHESQKLLQALDDVTDTHRLERGAYGLTIAPFDPGQVIAQVLAGQQHYAHQRDLHLLSRVYPGLPMMWSDKEALERALGRLLVVAITQAQPGDAVMAAVRALPNDELCFSVSWVALMIEGQAEPLHPEALVPAPAPGGNKTGFAVRFVQQMVTSLGGRLESGTRRFDLVLPAALHPDAMHADAQTVARTS